ncbi:Ferric reduction oxidase 4 [Prunus yedoensis var. nudiflora]|uniref:Ferric reduction oxidase 4 n=1 Tax=Prunus yedoensis var. nudiflora TaxID=2094558 RepID=A0A314ZT40_PRUYE|nr:Ferric reduction oxidase 4 [Prunus yedoensis var. nudiflora]
MVSSLVFLWCKRQNATEGKQVQNVDAYGTHDQELESHPQNQECPIAQATQVHYGTRPDLKKILLGSKESDVGVLVCGPRKMRHEVAKICSSGLADNLHFESISFNWVKRSFWASWKRPALVKGPLGIVSWIELSFVVMVIALLVWSISSYLHNMFATAHAAVKGEQVWETKLSIVALALGLVGNFCLSLLFFPVSRGSSILQLIGLTSEASIKYHIWLGHLVMTLFTAHGLCYIIYWANTSQIFLMFNWDNFAICNLAGEIALLAD